MKVEKDINTGIAASTKPSKQTLLFIQEHKNMTLFLIYRERVFLNMHPLVVYVTENWLQLLMTNCFNEWLVIVRCKTNVIFVYSWQQITHIVILCRIFTYYLLLVNSSLTCIKQSFNQSNNQIHYLIFRYMPIILIKYKSSL